MSSEASKHIARFVKITAILAFAFCLIASVGCSSSGGHSSYSNPDASLVAESLPRNGQVLFGNSSGVSSIKVKAPANANTYVKVIGNRGTQVAFFVRAGQSASVDVPSGTYSIHFASGDTWYGTADRFGSKTSYGQDKSVYLEPNVELTYTLTPVSNGNFSMASLSASDF